jgi:hypothetical protein
MRLSKRPIPSDIGNHDDKEGGIGPGAGSDEPVSREPKITAPERRSTHPTPDGSKPSADEPRAEVNGAVAQWVDQTEKAVARARDIGTPTAWRTAAQAAVVVAEMAQTMRVTTHAHAIAEQLAYASEIAAEDAHRATQAAADAGREADLKTRAAEEAEQAAQVASLAAATARRKTEQAAQVAPKAVEMARVAAQAAAEARSVADQLDEVVGKARQANTPEAWSQALQIAAALWTKETGPNTTPEDRLGRPA